MMYGGSDAAADLGPPSRRPPGPGDGVRVPGLERRRRRRLERGLVPRLARSARSASRRIDSEEFYDFQANRPCIRFGDETISEREIVWPTVEIFEAPAPRAPRDLVLVQGVEPSMRWRTFSATPRRPRRGARRAGGRHTRRAARATCRTRARCAMTGHASDASLLRAPRDPALLLRGPDRDRRRAARRLRADAGCRRRACGRRCPTTSPPPPTRRPRSRCCAASKA